MTVSEKAYAKLNLTLDVLGIREDGYHDLKSVMQTVTLWDDISLTAGTGEPWALCCNVPDIPCDHRNLAWKAAKAYCEAVNWDPEGLTIRITKRIPSGAGMGGGSADAAAVLRGLNRMNGCPLDMDALAELGGRIGSDVPFCVVGGTIMCEGRGELLRRLPPMPGCIFLGCKPVFSVSTPQLYRELDAVEILRHPDNDAMEAAITEGDISAIAKHIYNVFDPVVSAGHPEIDHIKGICLHHGAWAAQMTGSGSVVFAVMPDMDSARKAEEELKRHYAQVFIAEPV